MLDATAGQSLVGLLVGKAAFEVDPGSQPSQFGVRTPMAAMDVQQARFVAEHNGAQTALLTENGSVTFSSRAYPDVQVTVSKGEVSQVVPLQPPSVPVGTTVDIQVRIAREDGQDTLKTIQFGAPADMPPSITGAPPSGSPSGIAQPPQHPSRPPQAGGPPANVPRASGPPEGNGPANGNGRGNGTPPGGPPGQAHFNVGPQGGHGHDGQPPAGHAPDIGPRDDRRHDGGAPDDRPHTPGPGDSHGRP